MNHSASSNASFDAQNSEVEPVRSAYYGRFPKKHVVLLGITAYCFIHFVIRLTTSPILTLDEANAALLAQSFQIGYDGNTSTLLVWIFAAIGTITQLSLPVMAFTKYLLLGLGLTAYYISALTIFDWMDNEGYLRRRLDLAAASVGSWALIYMTGWALHEDQLPQVLDFAILSCLLLCFTSALTRQGILWWALFGFVTGLTVLTHYHLVLFPICLVTTALGMISLTRAHYDQNGNILTPPAITWPKVAIAFVTALIPLVPQILWLAQPDSLLSRLTLADFGWGTDLLVQSKKDLMTLINDRRFALKDFITHSVLYILPLLPLAMLLFWPMWFGFVYPFFPKRSVEEGPFERTWRRLFSYTLRLSLLLCALLALAFSIVLDVQWMLPVFFVLPIWFFFQVQRSGPYFISMRAFAGVIFVSMAFVPIARFIDWSEDIMTCQDARCHAYLPMKEFALGLDFEGFARGSVVGNDAHLLGNLRQHFPQSRFLDSHYPLNAFPKPKNKGTCMAIWRDAPEMPDDIRSYVRNTLGIARFEHTPQGAIRKSLLKTLDKHSVLYYRFLPPNNNCR